MNCPHCGYRIASFRNICEATRWSKARCDHRHCKGHNVKCFACGATLSIGGHLSPEGVTPVLEAVR